MSLRFVAAIRRHVLVLAALAACPVLAAAVDAQPACRVEFMHGHDEPSRWTGPCTNGLADGDGAFTSAHGTVVIGHFVKGQPVTADGRTAIETNAAGWMMTTYREAPGKMFLRGPLPKFPGPPIDDPVAAHALAGDWVRTQQRPGGACEVQDTIADDGRRTQRAGIATAEDGVTVYGNPHDPNLFRVLTTSLVRIGSHACLNADAPGDSRVFVVRFQDAAHTSACLSVDGSTCLETWRRAAAPEASAH